MVSTSRKFGLMIAAVVVAAALASAWLFATYRQSDSRAVLLPDRHMTVLPDPKPLAAFRLHDHRNQNFDLSRLKDKWTFLFFGFTHCPDVCPATMAVLSRVHERIAADARGAGNTQFVFVSVDPNRDSNRLLEQYVSHFDAGFLGVTGSEAQLRNLAGQLGAAYEVAYKPGVEDYPVYHSTAVFLLDREARYHALFTAPLDADVISRRFKDLREFEAARTG